MALGRYCIRGLTMVAILSAGSAEGLVIYRFGGQDQPPPPGQFVLQGLFSQLAQLFRWRILDKKPIS